MSGPGRLGDANLVPGPGPVFGEMSAFRRAVSRFRHQNGEPGVEECYNSKAMERTSRLRQIAGVFLRWASLPTPRALLPLLLVCMLGPLGEFADAALLSELEVGLLASDLGAEIVATLFLSGYQLLMLLTAGAWLLRGLGAVSGEGPLPLRVLVSCQPRPLAKIPIG